nr:DUF6596 domain-containing protein [Gayadomonas joobiniege]
MLLHESRSEARVDDDGDIILLEEQNRSLCKQPLIDEGIKLVQESLNSKQFIFYTSQAAFSAVQTQSVNSAQIDGDQIIALYQVLINNEPLWNKP